MDHGDSLKGNLFFAAGRAAASRGWFDAVLVTGSEVLNVSPVGPPVIVAIQGRGLDLEEAKALASASGAGRRILIAHAGSQPIHEEALPWIGTRIDIEDLDDSRRDTEQATGGTDAHAETGPPDVADDASSPKSSESPEEERAPVPEPKDKGPETAANEREGLVPESVTPIATQGTPSVGAEPPRRRRTVMVAAVAAMAALAAFGVWWVVGGKGRTGNPASASSSPSPSASPSASPARGGDRGFFDTANAERKSARFLAKELSTSKGEVSVRCPKDAPISVGSFTCSVMIDRPGDDVTGTVTYTLVRKKGGVLTLRGDYDFD